MRNNNFKSKNKILITILIILLIITGIIGGIYLFLHRGGTKVTCDIDYPVDSELVAYRQDDLEWAKDMIGDSKFDMESSGCVISSIATALSKSNKALNPGELNAMMSENNVFDSEGNLQWGVLANIDGFHADVYSDVSSEIIDDILNSGKYPVIRVVRGKALVSFHHYVLIIGAENGKYICMDPLEDKYTTLDDYNNKIYAIRCVWYEGENR